MFFSARSFFFAISSSIVLALELMMTSSLVMAQTAPNKTITGTTGGKKNSGDCGYIADKPNYVLNLSQQIYSMNVTLEADSGKPSLLIIGPGTSDRFCVLGEPKTGKKAKMGGVWAKGKYLIYVGDTQGSKNPFTLRIENK